MVLTLKFTVLSLNSAVL